jgi:hypothetical protein
MEQNVEYASLYEYLGRRAGMDLGQQVFKAAKEQKIRCKTQEVNQGGYSGKVMCYPRTFLKSYFESPSIDNSNNYNTY